MGLYKTCEGCPYLARLDPVRGRVLFGCNLGKFDYPRGFFESAPADQEKPSAPIPAWCKLGKGYTFR